MMKKELRIKIWNKYNKRCAYCGCKLEYKQMQVDHIQSKIHHEYFMIKKNEDRQENLNPSCRQCNFYKGGGTLEQFRKSLSTLHERFEKLFIVRLALKYGILQYKKFDKKFYFEKWKK